jgi:hypothetical protein
MSRVGILAECPTRLLRLIKGKPAAARFVIYVCLKLYSDTAGHPNS